MNIPNRPNSIDAFDWFKPLPNEKRGVPYNIQRWSNSTTILTDQLYRAIEIVKEQGGATYIDEGLRLALKIVQSGTTANVEAIVSDWLWLNNLRDD